MNKKAENTIDPDFLQYKGNDYLIKFIERMLQRLDKLQKELYKRL